MALPTFTVCHAALSSMRSKTIQSGPASGLATGLQSARHWERVCSPLAYTSMMCRSLPALLSASLSLSACFTPDENGRERDSWSAGAPAETTGAQQQSQSSTAVEQDESSTGSAGTSGPKDDQSATGEASNTGEPDQDAAWDQFVDARSAYLSALAVPIASCLDSGGSNNPAFDRCGEWTQHVQALYAMHALTRLTGDPKYVQAVAGTFDADDLENERTMLDEGDNIPKRPYGHGWLLALAVERERTVGDTDLRPLANDAAANVQVWLGERSVGQLQGFANHPGNRNLSWALLNLHRYADWTNDGPLRDFAREYALDFVLSPSAVDACSPQVDAETSQGVFSPCNIRFMLALEVDALEQWLPEQIDAEYANTPGNTPDALATARTFGRAWGLWSLYQATDDTMWRDAYVDHINAPIAQAEHWETSDWLPQLAIYAIAMSYPETWPET